MKYMENVCPIDNIGRVVLPESIRDMFKIENDTPLEMYFEEGKVVLKKYDPSCVFCQEISDVIDFRGKMICVACIDDLRRISQSNVIKCED